MKILKLLNKKNFLILFFLFFTSIANAEEKPVDIWNIDKKEIEEKNTNKQFRNFKWGKYITREYRAKCVWNAKSKSKINY